MRIQELPPEQRKYTYTQSQQLIGQTGCIGHLRAVVDTYGSFQCSWDDHNASLKVQEFKNELDYIINTLRSQSIFVDKNDNIIEPQDRLRFDDGTEETVFDLADNTLGISATNPNYERNHPDADKEYTPLPAKCLGDGIYKLSDAQLVDCPDLALRSNPSLCGPIFHNRSYLARFCYTHHSAAFDDLRDWGIRVDTAKYSYLMRLNPNKGEYSLYCYCYVREWLDQHIHLARNGIRFITPIYEDRFTIPDGDKIRIINAEGGFSDHVARFIDAYHVELSGIVGSNIYHIAELAEIMERQGSHIIPLRSSLPESCYVFLPTENRIGIVKKGESGYYRTDLTVEQSKEASQATVDEINASGGVTKAQAKAMSAGSMFGWDTMAADPAYYDENGTLQNERRHDRGDAR